MKNKVRVNVTSTADIAGIRRETRNGREKIIVPSATMPDDIVMNGILYPADEIANSFLSLQNTLAPFGHPEVNGAYVSAADPDGLVVSYVGIHNDNVRRENGRVFIDKVIDVETANRSDDGKAILNAIEKGEPINTSTGLICELEDIEDDKAQFVARNIEFDHDAILLNEAPAATPEQGVGMLVNKKAVFNGEEIKVVNSFIEDAERELEWAVEYTARAIEKVEKASSLERLKAAILEVFTSERTTPATNEGDADMADDKQLDGLSAKVNSIAESVEALTKAIPEQIANAVKPLTDNLSELQANQKAKDDAELADLQEKIVKANVLNEEEVKQLPLNAARKLAANQTEPGSAAPVNGAFIPNKNADDGFKLPEGA